MTGFFQLFYRYVIRDVLRNRARVALTIAGIALGISVVVAVQLANDRAIGSFNDSIRLMAGDADLQITANGLPVPEELFKSLSWVWDYGSMSPVIEGRGILNGAPVQIFGLDLLSRSAGPNQNVDQKGDGNIDLLLDPHKVIITEVLAKRLGLSENASFDLVLGDRREAFTVGAIADSTGVGRAFSGNVLLFDIAAAQLALRKLGVVDRIDIDLHNNGDAELVRERLQSELPATAAVNAPEATTLRTEKLLRAFRYNLTALSYISLMVGVILIYNTLTIAVIRRRPEIGMLRTLGTSRRTIAGLFLIEASCLGLVGALLGILFGEVLARAAGVLVTRTIESLYTGVFALPTSGAARPAFYAEVLLMGLLLSIVSAIGPALRATRVSPVSVLRSGIEFVGRARRSLELALAGAAALSVAIILTRQPALSGFPVFGYTSAVLFIAGFALLTPVFSRAAVRLASAPIISMAPIEGRLATQSMRSNSGRVVTAVVSLSIAVAMLVSVVTMVASFRETVVAWVNQTMRADLYIRAAAAGPNDWSNPFDENTVKTVATLPDVAAIDRYRGRAMTFNGTPIVLSAGEFEVMSRYSDQQFMDGRPAAEIAPRMLNENRVIASEPFFIKQGKGKGDTITLPTAEGEQQFTIEAVFYDYSNDRGTLVMDRSTYLRLFHDTSVTNIAAYLKPGVDPAEVQRVIAQALPDAQLRVFANSDLKRQVLRVFDQTFQVTYALEAIALVVAILGITNTLSALILERRAEFAMLRFVGVDRRQLRKVVVIESGMVGVTGSILGLLLGMALSLVLVFVINKQSFGWTIQFVLPAWFFVQSLSLIVAATIIAGLYPAALATRMDAIQGIRAE